MMMIFYPIYFGLIFISNYQTINSLSCKDESGKRVSYYVIYKPPKEKLEKGYYHISKTMPQVQSPGMILSNLDIGDPNSFVGKTFEEVYENPDKFNYIMFSDKIPIGSESSLLNSKGRNSFGRTKGVIAWSTEDVNPTRKRPILFLHSVPEWLPKFSGKSYYWPESSRTSLKKLFSKLPKLSFLDSLNNAHMAVCINLHFDDIKDVILLLIISDLQVYEKNIISGDQLALAEISTRKLYADSDLFKNFKTPSGIQFTIHTKPKSRIGDIFKMMSRNIDTKSFEVLSRSYVPKLSSFRNLSHRLKPKCKIGFSKILGVKIGNLRWASRQDESSWASSSAKDRNFFCFSTLPQTIIGFKESGSMICIDDSDLNKAFFNAGKELDCKY